MELSPLFDLFAGELRRLRTAAGLSQEALGEKINYSASLVAAVEQCRRPPRLEFAERADAVLGADGLLLRIRAALLREVVLPWFREWVAIERRRPGSARSSRWSSPACCRPRTTPGRCTRAPANLSVSRWNSRWQPGSNGRAC
ncbi:helix-turn-helix domain-containing protein [Micromonospora zhanjiangensis]